MKRHTAAAMLAALTILFPSTQALASFGCFTPVPTFRQEIEAAHAVVFLKPAVMPPVSHAALVRKEKSDDKRPRAYFTVVRVLKGKSHVKTGDILRLDTPKPTDKDAPAGYYAVLDGDDAEWSYARDLRPELRHYLSRLADAVTGADPAGFDPANFYFDYWNSESEGVAEDAQRELEALEHGDKRRIARRAERELLINLIRERKTPTRQVRLALTLLALHEHHHPDDIAMLKHRITSSNRQDKIALDATITSYLTLAGEAGLKDVQTHVLLNTEAEYGDTYSAVMALRWHADHDILPRPRILQAMRSMLNRPDLAVLVVVDLANLQDWTVIDRLVELFGPGDEAADKWIRVPTFRYLMACPLPEAKERMRELRKIDPEAYRKAVQFHGVERIRDANGVE